MVLAEICDFSYHLLTMTLVGDSNVHIVGNVTGRVFGAVNVEDRNGVAQGLERELLFLSPSLINKDYICAAV